MRVYIASPYTAPTKEQMEANANKQIEAGVQLMQMGIYPFIPLLSHWVDIWAKERGIGISWEKWIDWDLHWLEQCDALLFLGESKGSLMELNRAKELGMPVYYSVDEIRMGGTRIC